MAIKGFGHAFYVIVYSNEQKAYHVELLLEYLAINNRDIKEGKTPRYSMIAGLFSSRKDVDEALKDIREPELILNND